MKLSKVFAVCLLVTSPLFARASVAKAANKNIDAITKAASLDEVAAMNKAIAKEKKVDLNKLDSQNLTPLMSAAGQGSLNTLKELLKKNVNLEAKNTLGDTALAVAVQLDQVAAAELLINAGANTDIIVSGENKNPLLLAAAKSNFALTKLMLEKNPALINKTNALGETALMASINYGYNDIMKLLLDRGADRYIRNKDGKAALDIAKDSQNQEAIKILTTKK